MNDDDLIRIKSLSRRKLEQSFEYLGEGSARVVFAFDNGLVMKIAKNRFGLYQNMVETYVFEHAGKRFEKYLCPVVKSSPEILIAKRAVPVGGLRFFVNLPNFCGTMDFYQDISDLTGAFLLNSADIRARGSWGILDSNKVLIDYGCPNRMGDKFYRELFSH